jgi:uncharacterized OB-fold protein
MASHGKANDSAKSASGKTGDAAEKTKLNAKISSEQDAIDAVMKQIGEFYYNKYLDAGTADKGIAGFCAAIDGHKAEIERIKSKGKAAPAPAAGGGLVCSACGAQAAPGMKFCQECGAKITAPAPAPAKAAAGGAVCSACGARLAPGMKFCQECGAKITSPAPAHAAGVCRSCGNKNTPGTKFCRECGAKF